MKFDQQDLSMIEYIFGTIVKVHHDYNYQIAVMNLTQACFYREDNITISPVCIVHSLQIWIYSMICA